jgi:hypothetical protein
VGPLKRSCPTSAGDQPQPLNTRPLPEAVWEDHLLPLLTCKDAARLARTCKALSGKVREHLKDLGRVKLTKLQAALTTFPRARTMGLQQDDWIGWGTPPREALVEWMRGGGRGGGITTLMATSAYGDMVQ